MGIFFAKIILSPHFVIEQVATIAD